MREILFRGKTRTGEWAQGYYEHFEANGITYPMISVWGEFHKDVIPETVGQYTGLTDKNGTKIFEGDYIVCHQSIQGNFIDEHVERGYVEMKHGAFGLHRKQGYYRPFKDWLEDYEYEIIGNIHDNPELLKGDKSDA